MIMVQKWRCDNCETPFPVNELRELIDGRGYLWFRCAKCVRKWGIEPRSEHYYCFLETKWFVSTFDDPATRILFGPGRTGGRRI